MARPLRIEFSGALYHVTGRGDRREVIYEDDEDRMLFLSTFAEVAARFNWICHGYCLMTDHYHLVVETVDGNLSKGMRQLNGVYTQASNRRHRRSGHLFQGRYKSILVDSDAYLLELARYVVLNPVRARMVKAAGDWHWSSYKATVGASAAPDWLAVDGMLRQFGRRRGDAIRRYKAFIAEGVGQNDFWNALRQQIFLGDEQFIERMLAKVGPADEINIPKAHRRPPPPPLNVIAQRHEARNDAIAAAYATGGYSYAEIAAYFDVHPATVGRVVRKML